MFGKRRSQENMRIDELERKISKLAEKTAIWQPMQYWSDFIEYPVNEVLKLLLEKLGFELAMEEEKPKQIKLEKIKKERYETAMADRQALQKLTKGYSKSKKKRA